MIASDSSSDSYGDSGGIVGDGNGNSVHSLLSNERTIGAAQAFFSAAVAKPDVAWPATVNIDGNRATHQSLVNLGEFDARWRAVKVRENRYINNRIELAHRIRKDQFDLPDRDDGRKPSLRTHWDFALGCAPDDRRPTTDVRRTLVR